MRQPYQLTRVVIGVAFVFVFSVFVYWALTVVLPITFVEIRYQYKALLRDAFQVTDIRGLILPQFRFDLRGFTSKYVTDGITIPSLFLDEPVIYNIDPNDRTAYLQALTKGIAHASSTSFPGTGGLGYYFAHSSSPEYRTQYNAVFYLLRKLKKGDEVYIWHNGTRSDYAVTETIITQASDVTFLSRTFDRETIVLQTCWPPGTTKERLLVFASLLPK